MKMTMHIDEKLLDRVVEKFGCTSKTEAVEMALKEMDRKSRFKEMVKAGLGLSPEELKNAVDPDYDVTGMRVAGYTNRSSTFHGRKRSR
jgi:Arc/MetJ family transcription regulator